MKFIKLRVISFLALIVVATSLQASVGKALYTIGNVTVERPAVSTLSRGGSVEEGDVVVTGAKGYAQLKLVDGTKIAIRPNSRFIIEALEAPATATTPAIGAGTTLKAKFNLQKGGFRTITGRIAKRNPSSYQLTTPTAIIGVRGTNYTARVCSGDCVGSEDGLYVGVSNGGVSLSNDGGSLELAKNQYGFSASFAAPPTRLIAPPTVLSEDGLALVEEESEESEEETDGPGGSDESSDEGSDESAGGSDEGSASMAADRGGEVSSDASSTASTSSAPATQDVVAVDVPEQEIATEGGGDLTDGGGTIALAKQGLSFSTTNFASGINTNELTTSFDDNNGLTGFDERDSSNALVTYDIGTGVNRNLGFDSTSELRWGRWAAGSATQTVAGVTTNLDLETNGLHWVIAPDSDVEPTQVITGSASYVLVGNTDPTDNLGNVGVLGSASFSADFTNATVDSSLQLGINSQVWTATGSGTIDSKLFSGLYSTVTTDGVSGGSGNFGGIFAGFSTEATTPSGAGLNYNITNGTSTVNGAAVFNKSAP